jgi:hypothetical protein
LSLQAVKVREDVTAMESSRILFSSRVDSIYMF